MIYNWQRLLVWSVSWTRASFLCLSPNLHSVGHVWDSGRTVQYSHCAVRQCSTAPLLVHLCFGINAPSAEVKYVLVWQTGSQFWLFRGLSLQEGYPQPLAALRMGAAPAWAEEEEAASRWGLMWDPEDGPVWGSVGGFEAGQQAEDTWTQLLEGGVSGITTDRDGRRSCSLASVLVGPIRPVYPISSDVRSGEQEIYNQQIHEMLLISNGTTWKSFFI